MFTHMCKKAISKVAKPVVRLGTKLTAAAMVVTVLGGSATHTWTYADGAGIEPFVLAYEDVLDARALLETKHKTSQEQASHPTGAERKAKMSLKENTKLHAALPNVTLSEKDIRCLAENIYYEARGESLKGQIAVALVTLHRAKNNHRGKSTVCGVVYDSYQFSWTLDDKRKIAEGSAWKRAQKLARNIANGGGDYEDTVQTVAAKLAGADHYHADYVAPKWAKDMRLVAVVGSHRFYKRDL